MSSLPLFFFSKKRLLICLLYNSSTPSLLLSIPPEVANTQIVGSLDKNPCNVQHRGCGGHAVPEFDWARHAVEPKTGIQFPAVLNSILSKDNQSNLSPEVLLLLLLPWFSTVLNVIPADLHLSSTVIFKHVCCLFVLLQESWQSWRSKISSYLGKTTCCEQKFFTLWK